MTLQIGYARPWLQSGFQRNRLQFSGNQAQADASNPRFGVITFPYERRNRTAAILHLSELKRFNAVVRMLKEGLAETLLNQYGLVLWQTEGRNGQLRVSFRQYSEAQPLVDQMPPDTIPRQLAKLQVPKLSPAAQEAVQKSPDEFRTYFKSIAPQVDFLLKAFFAEELAWEIPEGILDPANPHVKAHRPERFYDSIETQLTEFDQCCRTGCGRCRNGISYWEPDTFRQAMDLLDTVRDKIRAANQKNWTA